MANVKLLKLIKITNTLNRVVVSDREAQFIDLLLVSCAAVTVKMNFTNPRKFTLSADYR